MYSFVKAHQIVLIRPVYVTVGKLQYTIKMKCRWEVRGKFKREGTYAYLWLIHVDIWQKPTQYCKAIILQLKKKYIKSSVQVKLLQSHVQFSVILLTVAHQAPLSMGFSKGEYWSGLLWPPPRDLPNPGIELISLMSPELAGRFFTTSAIWEAQK